jgi:hypothetical protein
VPIIPWSNDQRVWTLDAQRSNIFCSLFVKFRLMNHKFWVIKIKFWSLMNEWPNSLCNRSWFYWKVFYYIIPFCPLIARLYEWNFSFVVIRGRSWPIVIIYTNDHEQHESTSFFNYLILHKIIKMDKKNQTWVWNILIFKHK